jgi:SAM-dependent methyltransferase
VDRRIAPVRSALGRAYKRPYDAVCGRHPNLRVWHSQWLGNKDLYSDLRGLLAEVEGDVLDVGCGEKPYEAWTPRARRYVGIDVEPGPEVDLVIRPRSRWELPDDAFDAVLCTQVLEHAVDPDHVLAEIERVLRPGGRLIVSFPFIYNQHAFPGDYRRFSRSGARTLLESRFEVQEVLAQGGIGSSTGVMFLNWVELSLDAPYLRLLLFTLLLPAWIALSALVNALGWALDGVDRTGAAYGNVLAMASKPR